MIMARRLAFLTLPVWIVASCGQCGRTPGFASEASHWERRDVRSLQKICSISVTGAPRDGLAVFWSPNGQRLAWFTTEGPETLLTILTVAEHTCQKLPIDAKVHYTSTTWDPQGRRLLIGTYVKSGRIPLTKLPTYAELLMEIDDADLSVIRTLGPRDLGGYPNWAQYSPSGKELLVTVEPREELGMWPDPDALREFMESRKTLLIHPDNTIDVIAAGRSSFTLPQWSYDDTALVYKTYRNESRSILGIHVAGQRCDELTFHPLEKGASPRVLAELPDSFTAFGAYAERGGIVRYEVEDSGPNGREKRWEIWDCQLDSGRCTLLVDLKALLGPLYDTPLRYCTVGTFSTDGMWCFACVRTTDGEQADYWCVSLGPKRVMGRLGGAWTSETPYVSPDGRRLACVTRESSVTVYDLEASLQGLQELN